MKMHCLLLRCDKWIIMIYLFLVVFLSGITSYPTLVHRSPCPGRFEYRQVNISEWVALITVPPPKYLTPIKLDVYLYLTTALPTKYAGILELYEPRSIIIKRLKEEDWTPIPYIVRFPLQWPLATVKNISVNNQTLCIGPPVSAPVLTTIHLEHTLYPMRKMMSTSRPPDGDGSDTRINNLDNDEECGMQVGLSLPVSSGSSNIERGAWPWQVAIYLVNSLGLQFHCSATLITNRHIITAAHCVSHESTGTLMSDSILIYFGKFNLKHWTESDSFLKQATGIHIHPDYNQYSYKADIAVIDFEPVKEWTPFVRPACLWSQNSQLEPYLGQMGTVVGWGRSVTDKDTIQTPRLIQVPLISRDECIHNFPEFHYIALEKTLCAGNKNGNGPCNGDSGAGLLLQNPTNSHWELRGIVSLSLLNITTQSCELSVYFVLTDVAKYRDWLLPLLK